MDWMYDGRQVQKEDYLLGKKVDKNFGETTDNESMVPPQIRAPDSNFSQVDLTKKILEDPLVNIKKREIECTQKILQNPVFLKKQQNVKLEKHTIEDHQLDMILVSRLKSYEKAGLDLSKILSITKHKKRKDHKSKHKTYKSSSEEDEKIHYEKLTNKQKKYEQKSNNFERENKKHNHKKSFEYEDHKRNGDKTKNNTHRSALSTDDISFNERDKLSNESVDHHRYKDNKRYVGHKSSTKKHQPNEVENTPKNSGSIEKKNYSKYKQEYQTKKMLHSDGKRQRSESFNREMEQKKSDFNGKNIASKHGKSESNNHHKNSSDEKQESQAINDSRSMHIHVRNVDRRSRSRGPKKEKHYQKTNKYKKDKTRDNSSDSSSSSNKVKTTNVIKQTSKRQHSPEIQSDCEKHTQYDKDNYNNGRNFGLFVPKGHSIKKSSNSSAPMKIQKSTTDVQPKSPPIKKKKLTEEDMERMRKEMMNNAKTRDKERSTNVKRYRKEDKKEEDTLKPYSKDFFIKQLSHAASQVSVERSIKSNVNKLQKDNNFIE